MWIDMGLLWNFHVGQIILDYNMNINSNNKIIQDKYGIVIGLIMIYQYQYIYIYMFTETKINDMGLY